MMALAGEEILFYPTAIGWLPEEKKEFGPELRQRLQGKNGGQGNGERG